MGRSANRSTEEQSRTYGGCEIPRATWPVLGGLRYVLALIVAVSHTKIAGALNPQGDWRWGAFGAVMGFFLISGFSMAHSFSSDPNTPQFYRRRVLRILPLNIGACLLTFAVYLAKGPSIHVGPHELVHFPTAFGFFATLFLLQGLIAAANAYDGPLWSLGAEWLYYIATPLLHRRSTKALLLIAAVSAGAYLTRIHIFGTYWSSSIYGISAGCLFWAWLIGFVYYRNRVALWAKLLLVVAPPALIWLQGEMFSASTSPIVAVAAALVISAAPSLKLSAVAQKALYLAGEYSYPLYVVHFPILLLIAGVFHSHALILAASVLLPQIGAVAIYYLIDKPIRAKKRYAAKPALATT